MGCKRLGELCDFFRGASVPRARMYDQGDDLYIHYGDLYKGFDIKIDVENPQKPIPYILANENIKREQHLSDQDIVYVLTSETEDDLGHSFLFNNPRKRSAVAGTETTIVRVKERQELLPAYLNYLMHSPRFLSTLRQYVRGMKVFRVHPKDVARIEIKLPSLDIQRQVVAVLDSITKKQLINNQINDYLLKIMRANFKRLFSHQTETIGSIYDIAEVIYGAAFSSSLFNEAREGFPLIRIRDLATFDPQFYTTENHPKKTVINPGDVVAGMDAEFMPTFWLGSPALLNQRVCHFAPPQDSEVTPSYLLFALEPLLQYIQNYATGTTVAHLGKSDLEALEVGIPSYDSLRQFAIIAEPMRWQIVQNSIENRNLSGLRDALLPKLVSGEIDVSKVDITQLNNHLSDY